MNAEKLKAELEKQKSEPAAPPVPETLKKEFEIAVLFFFFTKLITIKGYGEQGGISRRRAC